jgi:hypothetical protein
MTTYGWTLGFGCVIHYIKWVTYPWGETVHTLCGMTTDHAPLLVVEEVLSRYPDTYRVCKNCTRIEKTRKETK